MRNYDRELDRLSSITPFFCKTGTHRAAYGETLLDHGRRFNTKEQDKLQKTGKHWKSTPGPGAYRTPRALGPASGDEMSLHCNQERLPIWKVGTGPQQLFVEQSMATAYKSPGPGTYTDYGQ